MPNKPTMYPLDITQEVKILSERETDWQFKKATIIQAAVHIAFRYMAEWHTEAQRIHARKTETLRGNANHARKFKLTRKDKK